MTQTPMIDDTATLWSAPENERDGRDVVLLLHGYGADERDLFSLAQHLPDEFVYAALRAPLPLPWPAAGFSWYPIEGLETRDDAATNAAAHALWAWIDEHAPNTVGLIGFSQGGAISLQSLRMRPEALEFTVNLSGYATPVPMPNDEQMRLVQPAVFWGRGTHDEVIPQPLIEHTKQWLPSHAELSGRVYQGLGHAVSTEEIADVIAFLQRTLPLDESSGVS